MRLMEHFGISGLTDTLKLTTNDEVFKLLIKLLREGFYVKSN